MAATDFKETFYESDSGTIMRMRADTKTLTAFPGNAGPADLEAHAIVGGRRRSFGVHCRGVRLVKEGATATEKNLITFIPVASKTAWEALAIGGTVTGYTGYKIGKKVKEAAN
jgi:hypothetical protein